jgi:hypothetical protein
VAELKGLSPNYAYVEVKIPRDVWERLLRKFGSEGAALRELRLACFEASCVLVRAPVNPEESDASGSRFQRVQ